MIQQLLQPANLNPTVHFHLVNWRAFYLVGIIALLMGQWLGAVMIVIAAFAGFQATVVAVQRENNMASMKYGPVPPDVHIHVFNWKALIGAGFVAMLFGVSGWQLVVVIVRLIVVPAITGLVQSMVHNGVGPMTEDMDS